MSFAIGEKTFKSYKCKKAHLPSQKLMSSNRGHILPSPLNFSTKQQGSCPLTCLWRGKAGVWILSEQFACLHHRVWCDSRVWAGGNTDISVHAITLIFLSSENVSLRLMENGDLSNKQSGRQKFQQCSIFWEKNEKSVSEIPALLVRLSIT